MARQSETLKCRLTTKARSKDPINSGVGALAMLCPSDEIRRETLQRAREASTLEEPGYL